MDDTQIMEKWFGIVREKTTKNHECGEGIIIHQKLIYHVRVKIVEVAIHPDRIITKRLKYVQWIIFFFNYLLYFYLRRAKKY